MTKLSGNGNAWVGGLTNFTLTKRSIMKLYLAARFARREKLVTDAIPPLEEDGHKITSRWLWEEDDGGEGAARMCLQDIDRSEALVLFTDPVGSKNAGGGRWFEAGYAYANNRRLFVVGEQEAVFTYLPLITVCRNIDHLRRELDNYNADLIKHLARPLS
jgi:hypothetical protein